MTDTEPDKLIAIVCFLSGGAAAPLHRRYSTFLPNLSPPPPCLPTEMTLWGKNLFNIGLQTSWAKWTKVLQNCISFYKTVKE